MGWKTGLFLAVLVAVNAAGAWYVLTRVQTQIFLEPTALAFRIGSQMPPGAADRGITPITPATQLPGLGRVILSSADGSRSIRFDRILHGDANTELSVTSSGAAVRFPALPEGATVTEALAKAGELEAFLTTEGFSRSLGRLEDGCVQLTDHPAGEVLVHVRRAFATGACAARPGSLFVFRMQRGPTRISFALQPQDGAADYPETASARVTSRVVIATGTGGEAP